jgi:amino acid adenylation domain-containing protein
MSTWSIANANPTKLPGPQLLHHLIRLTGDDGRAALEHTSNHASRTIVSYPELHQRAELLAFHIAYKLERAATSGQRVIVPLLIPQCPDLYISQLATLKAGGAFCPIVLDAPEERLRFILRDIDARILLTTVAVRSQLPHLQGVEIIAVDDIDRSCISPGPLPSISPQDAAYIMYTSGSTGQPKGVILSHSAACQALLAHDLHIPHFQRFLQFASPTFDVSVFEIFFPLFRGSTLISCDRRRLLNDLPGAINQLHVDACELTPSVASSLLQGRQSVPNLRVLLTIGEMLKPSVVGDFGGDDSTPAILHGMYGPTEATIHCTLHTYFPKDMSCNSIGVPLETVSAFVVKATTGSESPEIVEIGEEGELAVGGHQLADGYLNREEQTKAAFVQHPQYGLLYRTGDRARMLPDGRFECLGRISSGQVKLRGQRIELGEIEHAASRTAGCRDVVAEVISNTLVAFCVRGSPETTESNILETCKKWLPAFMVPGEIVVLDSLPYLASGKCDRKALRAQYEERREVAKSSDAIQDQDLQKIMSALSHILGAELEPSSSLPAFGLDSISSIRLVSELRHRGLPQLDAGHVLTARTPIELLSAFQAFQEIDECHSSAQSAELSYREMLDQAIFEELSSETIEELELSFPCTPVQDAMLSETSKNPRAYCNWVELAVHQCADVAILTSAVEELSVSHPLLRSGFVSISGQSFGHAVLTWKSLKPQQIGECTSFDREFHIVNDRDLLRPLKVQIMRQGSGHRLLFRIHHALYDQWALDLLQRDLEAILKGQQLAPHPSFKNVSDYYYTHNEDSPDSTNHEFWRNYLRDVTTTPLPILRAQEVPARLTRSAWRETSVLISDVREHSRSIGCSSPALFQTALAYILGSYTGSSNVTFGSVFSGRHLPVSGIDSIFGPCLATLPCRVDHRSAHSCRDLLVAVTDGNRKLQQHLLTSPTTIRKAAGVAPSEALFDTVFIWQETAFDSENVGKHVEIVDSADELEFNLVLEFEPSDTYIRTRATYQQQLFDSSQIERLLGQLEHLVSKMMQDPNRSMDDVGAALPSTLLSIVNPQPQSYAGALDITAMVSSHAQRQPSAPAILFARSMDDHILDSQSITYAGLDARANAMAHLFIEAGMKPHDIICICMEKSIDLYVAMLASFKAGGGYLSLVPETPAARVKSMLEQANITLCVCDSEPAVTFRGLSEATIIDAGSLNLTTYSTESPPVVQDEARIAYLISTSGSTGEPKGVPVTMSNLKGNLAVLTELYQVSPEDRLLQSCSQAFDVNVFEIFFTFTTGMCLCSARKDVMFADLEHSIRTLRATHLIMTPTVASLVHPENVPSVRFLVAAGEGMTERVHSDWADKGLHNGYGPSEATNVCCVKMNIQKDDTLGNIGPPLKNTSAFVIDTGADFRVLPSGSYGEFAFGGEQVFPGYLNRDDLNAVKIVNHPEYGRIFRSGDMGRILHDGTLLFSGRLDDQVKIRGNRVELGEINAVILNHRDVSDCTTIVLGKNSAEQMLISFWVPISEESSNSTLAIADASSDLIVDLYERLEAALPVYMTPSFLVPVNRLPTTTQGKLDKRLLLSAFEQLSQDEKDRLSRSHETSSEDMPTSPTEQAIAKVLALVLNVQESSLSRNVSFFAVGMNSLNAIRFAKGLEKQFQSRLSITEILRNPSILRLARIIDAAPGDVPSTQLKDVRDIFDPEFVQSIRASFSQQGNEVVDVLPCTPLQEAMLSSTGTSDAYCNTTKLHFDGDMDKLRRCWDEMTRRHEILRTAFVDTPYAAHPYAQVVLRESTLPWTTTSLQKQSLTNGVNGHGNGQANGHTNGKVNGNACAHQKGASTHKPKLEGITPLQPVRVTECESFVYLQMHHAIYDGISVANLFSEIQSLYHGEQLPPAVSLLPFLGQVLSQNNQAAIDFWKPRVQDFQPRPFPQHNVSSSGLEGVHEQIIPISPSELGSFSERYSCTPLSVLQAAWTKTLATLQSASTVCFGNVVNGRSVPVPEIDRLVAPCFNTLPVITQLDRIRTNLDLVISLHRNNIESLEFQLTATRKLQALSKYPSLHLFDSLLLVQPPTEDVAMWSVEEDEMDMGIPLVVEVLPEDESFGLQLHYLSANVSESLAQHIADGFIAALQSCLQYPSSSVDNFLSFDVSRINRKLESAYVSPDSNIEPGHGTTDAPWDAEEATIRDVFADLAGIDSSRINQQTSLYRIGLDSLNAVQVAYRLRKSGFKLDAADVMQYQTPKALASFIKSRPKQIAQASHSVALDEMDKKYRQRALSSLGIANQHVESVWPCTPAQSGMLAQFVQSEGVHYFNHTIYEIPENCSLEIIEAAWRAVQRKHQVLRMGFCENDDAKMPFSMVLYTQEGVPQQLIVTAASPDENEVQTAAAQSVLRALHLPAWRVTFFGLEHWKMCLSIHHALYDAESLRVLLVDFSRALRGEDLGRPTDISAVVQNQLDGAHMGQDEAEAFWKASLASTQLIKFPNLTPTNVSTPGAGSKEVMSSLSVAKIEDFCRAQGVTMQAVGQSTWALLLAAYLGEPNVTFGTVFSGSNGSSAGAAAFPSISTLPVHCDTSRNIPEIVQDMVSYNAMAQRYRYTPLTDIQRFAGSPGQPLFDTIFVFQKSGSGGEDAVLDWKITNNTLGVDYVASMEIEVSLKGDLLLRLTHDIRSIPEAHADLILRQFDRLLGEAIGATAGEISKDLLSIVPPKEASIPCDVELLHEFLERGSRRHPEKPALEFIYNLEDGAESRKIWTYEELNQRCNQVAHLIQHSGVKPGSTVAVCMSKCPEATFAFAGILKAGCAFLAMDPDLPLARRQFIVEDSRSRLLFVDAKSNVELEDLVTTVKLTEDMLLPFPTSSINIPKVDPNATSYCLYTSGTTGTPKGCELSHENAVQAMLSFQRLFADHWTEDSRWLQFASYWFDVSVLEQFWSWSVGITCIGAPRDLVLEDLPGFIRAANITHIDLTPSLARLLKPEDVPSLHHNVFITGGEALKQEIIDAWGPLHTIYNGYGPTEATIGVTMNTHIGPEAKPSNIGPAFDNVGAFVFAPDTDEPVLRGAVGELCVSGKLVGKGYLNRPDLTAKAFPYLERHGERVYRTGDLVRLLADESFSFIGRKDTQAKLRGQRLEIEEIDSVIKASSDAIADVASLVTKPSEGGGEMLVSFVADMETVQSRDLDLSRTTHSSQLVASADQACRDRLPAYMVPTHIIPITRLPLTVNNKVDTKRLVALFTSLSSRDLQQLKGQHHASNRPLHAVEKKIAKVLARLLSLQTEDIVPSSNVFSLGLSSVSAIALASLLKREGFRNATVAKIMERPTVESLGKILSKDKDGNDGEERSSIMQAKLRISAFAQRLERAQVK